MNDKSILQRLEEQGQEVPRVQLPGADLPGHASSNERYQIVGEIARGGVGRIYKGRDTDLGRDVAMKVLRDEHLGSAEMVHRFVEEAQIGGQLQHPGIVPVYELGVHERKRPYFAMKLVKGKTLTELLAARKGPAEKRRALLAHFAQACHTVAYAHSRGVIHRDLKPSNIMVGGFGEVQVVDWGFAKVLPKGGVADERRARREVTVIATVRSAAEGSASIAGSVMGTPAYMPPEQALGHVDDLTERADVFALGAILTEILTGEPPYTGEKEDLLAAAAHARLDDAYRRLDASGADKELRALARACLSALPKDRPRSAREVADAMSAYLAESERRAHRARVRAAEAEVKVKEQRRARRQTLVLAAAILLVVLLGGGGFLLAGSIEAGRERDRVAAYEAAVLEATRMEAAGDDWPGAKAAADRALGFAAEDPDRRREAEGLGRRIEEAAAAADRAAKKARDEAALLAKLDEIELSYADDFDSLRADDNYAAAIPDLTALEHFDRGEELAQRLDIWVWFRRSDARLKDRDWRSLDAMARSLDPDPWRNGLRDAAAAGDSARLHRLADELDLERQSAHSLDLLAVLLRRVAGDREAALRILQRAFELYPDDFWINYDLAVYSRDLSSTSRRKATAAAAVEHYVTAIALRPQSIALRRAFGQVLQDAGRSDDALAEYREALRLAPNDAMTHNDLGTALSAKGNIDGGLDKYREAARLDPGLATAHYNIGRSLTDKHDPDGAIAEYREALRLRPHYLLARGNLGLLLEERGDIEGAAAECREGLRLDPGSATAHCNMGSLLARKGDHDRAIAEFQEAVRLDPDLVDAHCALGNSLMAKGNMDGALAAYKEALRVNPDDAEIHGNAAVVLVNKGELALAIAESREAIRLDPGLAQAHAILGVALEAKGELQGAVAEFREAIRLGAEFPGLREMHADLLARLYRTRVQLVLKGEKHPADAVECLGMAELCAYDRSFGPAVRLYRQAFEMDPGLAPVHGYAAAQAAALAGGESRAMALAWMREALTGLRERAKTDPKRVAETLRRWKRDRDVAAAAPALPETERASWEALWADVDALLRELG